MCIRDSYSVCKNITDAPLNVQKRDKKEVEETANRLLEKMGIANKKDAYPCELSGGCLLYTSFSDADFCGVGIILGNIARFTTGNLLLVVCVILFLIPIIYNFIAKKPAAKAE